MARHDLGVLGKGGTGELEGVVPLADGGVVTGGSEGLLRWSADGGITAALGRFEVAALALHPDGRRLVVADRGGALSLQGLDGGKRRAIKAPAVGEPAALAWAGDQVAVAGAEGLLLVDPEGGAIVGPLAMANLTALVAAGDAVVAASGARAALFDGRRLVTLAGARGRVTAVAAAADGATLAVARGAAVQRYRRAPLGPLEEVRFPAVVSLLRIDAGGGLTALLVDGRVARWRPRSQVVVGARLTGALVGARIAEVEGAWAGPARALLWSTYRGRVEAYDLDTGACVGAWGRFGEQTRVEPAGPERAVLLSARFDGQSSFESLQLWDLPRARPLATPLDEAPPIGAWDLDLARERIVVLSKEGDLEVWSTRTGERTATIALPEGDDPDEGLLVLGLRVDRRSGRVIVELDDGGPLRVDVDRGAVEER